MRIRVSSPDHHLGSNDVDSIEKDLEKIDRRLREHANVTAVVRISETQGAPGFHAVVELDYGRNHLIAKAHHGDMGQAVRAARDELMRQINDRSRGGHSSFAKGT